MAPSTPLKNTEKQLFKVSFKKVGEWNSWNCLRLEVVEASVPSPEAGGLESGFSRFHFFVLRKRGAGSGHEEPEASIRNNLRKLMLS